MIEGSGCLVRNVSYLRIVHYVAIVTTLVHGSHLSSSLFHFPWKNRCSGSPCFIYVGITVSLYCTVGVICVTYLYMCSIFLNSGQGLYFLLALFNLASIYMRPAFIRDWPLFMHVALAAASFEFFSAHTMYVAQSLKATL